MFYIDLCRQTLALKSLLSEMAKLGIVQFINLSFGFALGLHEQHRNIIYVLNAF